MKYLLSLAFKNLTRYKRRTIITAGAIAYGLAMFIFMDSLLIGAEKLSERNLFEYETGSAQIYAPGYWEERNQLSTKHLIEKPEALIAQLEKAGIEKAAPRLSISCELMNENSGSSQRAKLFGIDPSRDEDVFGFAPAIAEGDQEAKRQAKAFNKELAKAQRKEQRLDESPVEVTGGRYLQPGDEGVVLGGWLAEELGLAVGDFVTLTFNMRPLFNEASGEWMAGSMTADEYEVVGLVKSGNPIVNRSYVMMDLALLDEVIEAEGAVSMIVLRLPENAKGQKMFAAAEQVVLDHFEMNAPVKGEEVRVIKSWRDLVSEYLALTAAKRGSSSVILLLIVLIAAVGISNTMMMSVMERKREIGMMRAQGMKRSQILWLFILEAGGIGILGAASGLMLGILANLFMVNKGIDYGFLLRDFDVGYRIADIFYGVWNWGSMFFGAFFTIIISALFAYFPARKSLKQPIPETLRVE